MKFDEDGWLDVAKEYNISDNSWDRGGVPTTHLVIHGTAGGSDGSGTLAYEASVGVSTHFAISTNGDTYQGIPCSRAAWANAPLNAPLLNFARADLNPNLWTISIEFCKPDTTNQIDITDAQKQSGFALIQAICDTYNIPKRRGDGDGGIIRHADLNSVDRSRCPGTFPFDELWQFLGQSTGGDTTVLDISQVNNYFIEVQKDTRWHCKSTGFDVAFGILTYYRTCTATGLNGLSQYGLPVSAEHIVTGHMGVTWQQFERGIIVYDPAHQVDSVPGLSGPCYPGHLDKFLPQSPPNQPTTPIVTINTQQAITTLQGLLPPLQAAIPAIQSVIKDLEPS